MSNPGNPANAKRPKSLARQLAGTANLRRAWEVQKTGAKCGAKAKSTGEPCRHLALENGRCYYHGGKTPKGKDWHKAQFVNAGRSLEKLNKKERELRRREDKRRARLAAMTDEERARHAEWHRTHKPDPIERQRTRQNIEAQKLVADALSKAGQGGHPAIAAKIAALESKLASRSKSDSTDQTGDIFE